jgi:CDGSH-type Zn-finger protein/uncharacterized Fe-S cluster protein YjdI
MSDTKDYRGSGVVVSFDSRRCIHAAECVGGLPQVFNPDARPWIQPDKAAAERIIAVVARCPSGALSVRRDNGADCLPVPAANEARIVADGPIYITGDIEVCDADGKLLSKETRVALCRCGASQNKPFCDNSHRGIGFCDEGSCGETDTATLGAGTLHLTVLPGGPMQVDGPLVVKDAFGEVAATTMQCWLCRCGTSKNKPFCDGSHKEAGFSG